TAHRLELAGAEPEVERGLLGREERTTLPGSRCPGNFVFHGPSVNRASPPLWSVGRVNAVRGAPGRGSNAIAGQNRAPAHGSTGAAAAAWGVIPEAPTESRRRPCPARL